MKKLLFVLLAFALFSCSPTNSESISSNSSSETSNSIISSEENSSTSSNNKSLFNEYGHKIQQAKKNIIVAHDSLTSVSSNYNLRKQRKRSSISQEGLQGEFIIGPADPEPLSKMITEPCSVAYSVLEALIISGNGDKEFSGVTYQINQWPTNVSRIDVFDTEEDCVFIRYGNYNMLLSGREDNPYACSFYPGNNDSLWINYNTTQESLTYWNSSLSWDEEIDALITSLDNYNQNGISGKPLSLMKSVLEKEESLYSWQANPSTLISDFEYNCHYLQPEILQQSFFSRHDRNCGSKDELIITDGVLSGINHLVCSNLFKIPDTVSTINNLETIYSNIYGLYVPSSVTKAEKGCLSNINVEFLFLDTLEEETDPELLESLLNGSTDIRVLFKNQWIEVEEILIPSEYHYSLYENNIAGIEIDEYLKKYESLYNFQKFLSKYDFNSLLSAYNNYIQQMITELDSKEAIEEDIKEFFEEVITEVKDENLEYYYINEESQEIVIEEITGETFLEHEVLIKEKE